MTREKITSICRRKSAIYLVIDWIVEGGKKKKVSNSISFFDGIIKFKGKSYVTTGYLDIN